MIRQGIVRFRRPCKGCDELFVPTGRTCRLCDKCLDKTRLVLKRKVNENLALRRSTNTSCSLCKKTVFSSNMKYVHGKVVCIPCRYNKNKASERLKLKD